MATGRRVDFAAIGLDMIGVDVTARAVPVDDRMRVAPGVWAIGDMIGKGAFTHVSMYQAEIVLRRHPRPGGLLPRTTTRCHE